MGKISKDEVFIVVRDLVAAKTSATPEEITMESGAADVGLDSLDNVELVMDLEKHFGIDIPDTEAEKFVNFGIICDYIVNALGETE